MSDPTNKIPSMKDFCVSWPLYSEVTVTDSLKLNLFVFIANAANIDCFCVDCEQESVFLGDGFQIGFAFHNFDLEDRIFDRVFYCSRDSSHVAFFQFRLKKQVLTKIGQSPSMADISEAELRPYSKVLSPDEYRELTKAVGLASHGVGIGSFVYLRRIFERLIEEARGRASQMPGWDEGAFQRSRMEEKIEILKAELPPFLVEHHSLYSILSKGIHELSEKECLDSFPIVRAGIELILDQKVAAKQQADKTNEAKKKISMLQQKIKSTQ